MTKTKKNIITMEGDEQDWEEGSRAQGVVSLGRRQTPQGKGRIALGQALNLKSCHISSLEEDN
jgi:predicted nucleotide-binding protein